MAKPPTFEIVAGTYEEFLLGYTFVSKGLELTQSFAAHDHAASIRCVARAGQYLASGGADDRIFIYDLQTRKLHFTLTHHSATINCLQFTEAHSHLISGSSDGVLAIVRVGNWQVEKIWDKAHKGAAVLDIAIHSSGKLALTLGGDGTLCTWNLIKGRQAYTINLRSKCKDPKSLEKILWCPDGERFVLYGGKYTEIWSIESGGFLKQIPHEEKVTTCIWFEENALLVGYETGEISNVDTRKGTIRSTFKAHDSRVKSIGMIKKRIVSISSNGQIKIWSRSSFEEVAVVDTGCRLTCLCLVNPIKVKTENNEEEKAVDVDTEATVEKDEVKKAQVVEVIEDDEEEDKERKNDDDEEKNKAVKRNKEQISGKKSKKKKHSKTSVD